MNTQTIPANDPVFHVLTAPSYPLDSHAAAVFGAVEVDVITILGSFVARDSKGRIWPVISATIEKTSCIADLYVNLDRSGAREQRLSDDEVFVDEVMSRLRAEGYTGEDFGRAELGMQGDKCVVLEPNRDFTAFAQSKGFILNDD